MRIGEEMYDVRRSSIRWSMIVGRSTIFNRLPC